MTSIKDLLTVEISLCLFRHTYVSKLIFDVVDM